MKKQILLFALAVLFTQAASAQRLEESKFKDNWFMGALGGLTVPAKTFNPGNTLEPLIGLRLGRWFTPYFAIAAEGQAYFGQSGHFSVSHTAINVWQVNGLGLFHVNNLFQRYRGEPRKFETIAFMGFGANGLCGASWKYVQPNYSDPHPNSLTSTFGLDFTYNFGSKKQWQAFVEPRMTYELANENINVEFNLSRALFTLNIGISYYFRNSNGTHNFTLYDGVDVEQLNYNLNTLLTSAEAKDSLLARKDAQLANKDAQLADKDAQIESLNLQIQQKKVTVTNLQPTVIFRQGMSIIDPAQFAPIELIAKYMINHPDAKVTIKGYASPEGEEQINKKLSEDRAQNVMRALIKKYGISADRLTAVGCGVTDKLFDQIEFNRVVTFNDDTVVE